VNFIGELAGLVTTLDGRVGATFQALRDNPHVLPLIALGALVGPLLGVSSSLLAVQHEVHIC
jgi:hypothetical protein